MGQPEHCVSVAKALVQGQACDSSQTSEKFPRAFDGCFTKEMPSSSGDGSGEVNMLNWYQCGKTDTTSVKLEK